MNDEIDWPLDLNGIRRCSLSNTYGPVRQDKDGEPKNHQGWDLYAAVGTPVYAIADGAVIGINRLGAYGIILVHSFKFEGRTLYAAYAHLDAALVNPGQQVKRGQMIARTGDSGNAEGMTGMDLHLHFEIRTTPWPGRGLEGRMSPLGVFGVCPRLTPEYRKGIQQ